MAAKPITPLKKLGYFINNLIIRGLLGAAMLLPYRWRVPLFGALVSKVLAPIVGWRARVRKNLVHVLPELPDSEVNRLSRCVPDNAGRTLIEIYSGEAFKSRAVNSPISGPGLEALEAARKTGRPVILVTGHMGNYDVVRAALIARGHNMGALYRRMRNPYFNRHYVRAISTIGEPMFEQGRTGMMQLVKHIRAGGIVGILTDLYHGPGQELMFFGKPAFTSLITAELALKYNAELVPVYAIRKQNGLDFEITVQAPIPHSDPETMTQAVNDGLESLVRAHPEQWFWIHRRWKPQGRDTV